MVALDLEHELVDEDRELSRSEICGLVNEFGRMSVFQFVYYATAHPEDVRRTGHYFEMQSFEDAEKMIKWMNFYNDSKRN